MSAIRKMIIINVIITSEPTDQWKLCAMYCYMKSKFICRLFLMALEFIGEFNKSSRSMNQPEIAWFLNETNIATKAQQTRFES